MFRSCLVVLIMIPVVKSSFQCLRGMRMYRIGCVLRMVGMLAVVATVLLFVSPLRNALTFGHIPRLWKGVPTVQLIKVQMKTLTSSTAALSPCTVPASDATARQRNASLLQLLKKGFHGKVEARPEDVATHKRALSWYNESSQRKQRYHKFVPLISAQEKAEMLFTWRVVHEALTLHNISHFLVEGSLLGALRHGGVIPWDDDIDLAVDEPDVEKVQRVLSCIPGYTLRMQPSMQWKFFAKNARVVTVASDSRILQPEELEESEKKDYVRRFHPATDVVMRYPFIDIFMMDNDGSFIWSKTSFTLVTNLYRVEDIYPLKEVDFDGTRAPVPQHSTKLLKLIYQANMCASPGHNHKEGFGITDITTIPCRELTPMYRVFSV